MTLTAWEDPATPREVRPQAPAVGTSPQDPIIEPTSESAAP